MKQITVSVPSGIGDIFWTYQRLSPHFDMIHYDILVEDDSPVNLRATGWPSLWPKVGRVQCIKHSQRHSGQYHRLNFMNRYLPLKDIIGKDRAVYSVNYPLDHGIRLEDTDPYPVEWSVPIHTEEWELPWEKYWALYVGGSLVEWGVDKWAEMLTLVAPTLPIAIVGASYDRRAAEPVSKILSDKGFENKVFIDTSPAKVCHLLKKAEYFICYQSGLGILADNMGTRQFMLYFENLEKLMYAWCHPDHVKSVYRAARFVDGPQIIAEKIRKAIAQPQTP